MLIKQKIKEKLLSHEGENSFLNRLFMKLILMRKVGFSVTFINLFFQRLLRYNAEANIPIHFTSRVIHFDKIKISYDLITLTSFAVSGHCYIQAYNGLVCGKNFLFAPGVKIITSGHQLKDISKPTDNPPVILGNDVWIGTNAVILPGVVIGDKVVIGAGAVVTKSFPESNIVIAGNPARIIGRIDE
ncbi:MAG: acyltransferase [Deferribacterales bacterium]